MPKLLTPKEAAANAGKCHKTMLRWIRHGWVKAKQQPNGREWLVWCDDHGQPLRNG